MSGQNVLDHHHDHTHQAATIPAIFHRKTHTAATGNSSSFTRNGTRIPPPFPTPTGNLPTEMPRGIFPTPPPDKTPPYSTL